METMTARTIREAHGAHCLDCGADYSISTSPYWHWSKSMAMHRSGSGHKVVMYRLVAK